MLVLLTVSHSVKKSMQLTLLKIPELIIGQGHTGWVLYYSIFYVIKHMNVFCDSYIIHSTGSVYNFHETH